MKKTKKVIVIRIMLVYILVVIAGGFIIWKTISIQVNEGAEWKEKTRESRMKYETIEAVRGNIYAEDGSLIATSIPIFDIYFDAASPNITDLIFDKNIDSLSYYLSKLFRDRSKSEYKKSITAAREDGKRYYLVKRRVTYNHLKLVEEFPIFRWGKYQGGLIIDTKTHREKPFKSLAARTIGYSSKNAKAYVGLEGSYNNQLEGTGGTRLVKKIAKGIWVPVEDEYSMAPEHGNDIYTTIDIHIQDVAQQALLKQLIKHKADHGCAVLMEVETGYIKAIANLGLNDNGYYEERYNYAVGESSEPGSTFKLASVMAGLEDKMFTLEDTVYVGDGWTMYYGYTMKDVHKIGDGWITIRKAFEESSNVGISRIVYDSYKEDQGKFSDRLYKFGLNNKLGIEIRGEGSPKIKNPNDKDWWGTTLPWMSTGYDVSITPLQLLTFYNAVANDGVMVKPLFVKEIRHSGEIIASFEPTVLNPSICSSSTLKDARELLEGVVLRGTATNLKNEVYTVGGKTGTAQIASGSEGYNKKNYKASFVGYFPADNPKFSCIVVVNKPTEGQYYGSQVAGPVFREIADKVYATQSNMYQVVDLKDDEIRVPDIPRAYTEELVCIYRMLNYPVENAEIPENWVSSTINNGTVNLSPLSGSVAVVPDVIGMGTRDAIYLLEKKGLKTRIKGRGHVKKQSLKPGAAIKPGNEIVLTLATI